MSMPARTKAASRAGRPATRLLPVFLALVPLLLTGCYTINIAQYAIPDNQTNRVVVTHLVASVAIKHGFVAQPADQMVMLSSYNFTDAKSKHPLNLDVFADAGTVTARLSQTNKKNKTRTESFLSAQRDLVKGFREKFGGAVEINIYNQEPPP